MAAITTVFFKAATLVLGPPPIGKNSTSASGSMPLSNSNFDTRRSRELKLFERRYTLLADQRGTERIGGDAETDNIMRQA